MEFLVGVLIGMFVTYVLKDKPFKIEIKHVVASPKLVEVPDMSTVMSKSDKEDETYEDMGSLLNEINNIMTGGSAHGTE